MCVISYTFDGLRIVFIDDKDIHDGRSVTVLDMFNIYVDI